MATKQTQRRKQAEREMYERHLAAFRQRRHQDRVARLRADALNPGVGEPG